MRYINIKKNGKIETIDEFETYREALKMLREYRLANSWFAGAYLSSRCTKEWRGQP